MKVVLKSVELYAPDLVEKTTHLTHGMVRLPGNQKMSSRHGNFLRAVDVLDMMPGTKVVVTPGMIELGNKTDELNEKFGEYASALDYVILVGEITTKAIVKGLKNKGFENYIVVDDIYDAFEKLQEMQISHQNLIALFENDLPDSYIERK